MKRILSIVIILLISITTVYALRGPVKGRTANRDLQKRSGHAKWAKCIAKDSDLLLQSQAEIEVDVDWFLEPEVRQGVDYLAWSYAYGLQAYADYECYAAVPNDDNQPVKKGTTTGAASVGAYAADFDWWESVDAEEALASCTGWVVVTQKVPMFGEYIVNSRTHSNAYKFHKKGES